VRVVALGSHVRHAAGDIARLLACPRYPCLDSTSRIVHEGRTQPAL
jgi:hypothetical protein